jgi:hypothetical protein
MRVIPKKTSSLLVPQGGIPDKDSTLFPRLRPEKEVPSGQLKSKMFGVRKISGFRCHPDGLGTEFGLNPAIQRETPNTETSVTYNML